MDTKQEKVSSVGGIRCLTCEGLGFFRPPNPIGARQAECCPSCGGSGLPPTTPDPLQKRTLVTPLLETSGVLGMLALFFWLLALWVTAGIFFGWWG